MLSCAAVLLATGGPTAASWRGPFPTAATYRITSRACCDHYHFALIAIYRAVQGGPAATGRYLSSTRAKPHC